MPRKPRHDVPTVDRATYDTASKPLHDAAMDARLKWGVRRVAQGDALAAKVLHADLAQAVAESNLAPYARELLMTMHGNLAQGMAADVAMLMKAKAGRKAEITRHAAIYRRVEELLAAGKAAKVTTTKAAVFKQVAKEAGLGVTSVKTIYYDERTSLHDALLASRLPNLVTLLDK